MFVARVVENEFLDGKMTIEIIEKGANFLLQKTVVKIL